MGFGLPSLLQLAARTILQHTFGVGGERRPVVGETEGAGDFVGAEVPHFDMSVANQGGLDGRRHDDARGLVRWGVDV